MVMTAGEFFSHSFGQPQDNQNDEVIVTFINDPKAIDFLVFDEKNMRILISRGDTTNNTAGQYSLAIILEDNAIDDVGGPMSSRYDFDLYIKREVPLYSEEGTLVTLNPSSNEWEEIPTATEIYDYNTTEAIPMDPVTELTGDAFEGEVSNE